MVYVDTSVLVALFTNEATAGRISLWYENETRPLVSGDWCVTEFASALSLKERTAQLTHKQSNAAWKLFTEFCGNGLRLLPLDREVFSLATHLVRDSKNGLRAGDALHLALALHVQTEAFFTLDIRLGESAKQCMLSLAALP
jgi:predicted nucleic acid-binding protein